MKQIEKRLKLEDVSNLSDVEISSHWLGEWAAPVETAARFNPVVCYESVGSWGCDSSAWYLLQERSTGKLFEVHGSHCSCMGFENQFKPEATTVEYLLSDKFYFSTGGYDDQSLSNTVRVRDFLKEVFKTKQ